MDGHAVQITKGGHPPAVGGVQEGVGHGQSKRLLPDPRARSVIRVWRKGGLSPGTIRQYTRWVGIFLRYCSSQSRESCGELTRKAADRFADRYARDHCVERKPCQASARSAIRAWAWGLAALGEQIPKWEPPKKRERKLPRSLAAYREYRLLQCCNVTAGSVSRDLDILCDVHRFLRKRRRTLSEIRLTDIDVYVLEACRRYAPRTVDRVCCALRAYLRFLYAMGIVPHDLAPCVSGPGVKRSAVPPRALPWSDVRAILKSINRKSRIGCRDYALLLTMAMYGFGAAEVRGLQIEDVDWSAGLLHVRRPKTGQHIVLPLLPAVGQALLAYLRRARPTVGDSRTIFLQVRAPYEPLSTSGAVRHILMKHARLAGVRASFLGSHALRHSHATRQIEIGAQQKIVGDILGHRDPSSTSVYVRVAISQLRRLALPVPR